jgi:hypothetical protein
MAGSSDATLGSDPVHQDRPQRWLGGSILQGAVFVQKARMEPNKIKAPRYAAGLNGGRFGVGGLGLTAVRNLDNSAEREAFPPSLGARPALRRPETVDGRWH